MNEVQLIPINKLLYTDFDIKMTDAIGQYWSSQSGYYGYVSNPRPYSGFMLVCDEKIEVNFFMDNGITVTAKKNNIVYIPYGCIYKVEMSGSGNGIDDYLINFNMDISGIETVFSEYPEIICENGNKYQSIFEELSVASLSPRPMPSRIKALVYDLICRIMTNKLTSTEYYPIKKGITYLEKNWNKNIKISEIASICGVSESYFRRIFLQFSGYSPIDYRNMMRISNAKALLVGTKNSIKDIATETGFDDSFYFSRIFKKYTGQSPTEYRNQKDIILNI